MRIIVCGGGDVGFSIAEYLSEDYELVLVDQDPSILAYAAEKLDIRVIQGNAADPGILAQADAGDVSIFVAVTGSDETNLLACQLADAAFQVPLKIARFKEMDFSADWLLPYRNAHYPVDITISPEEEVAREIVYHLYAPFALSVLSVHEDILQVIGFTITSESPLANYPLKHLDSLFADIHLVIFQIERGDEAFIPQSNEVILPGDNLYVLLPTSAMEAFMYATKQQSHKNQKILILGGGRVGLELASRIEKTHPSFSCVLIEDNKQHTRQLVSNLNNTLVLQGDALDHYILEEAGVDYTDTVVAITNDDRINILGSLLAKKNGAKRAITLLKRRSHTSLVHSFGIDRTINPAELTVSLILQRVRKHYVRSMQPLGKITIGYVVEIQVHEHAPAIGLPQNALEDVDCVIGCVMRQGTLLPQNSNDVLEAQDYIILFATHKSVKRLYKLFSPESAT